MFAPVRSALALIGAGLLVLLVAMPFATVRVDDVFGLQRSYRPVLFNEDDLYVAVLAAVVVALVVVALVLRRPMLLAWVLLPAGAYLVVFLLIASDIQFGTRLLTNELGARLNEHRSLALGGVLELIGLVLVNAGALVPLVRRVRASTTDPPDDE
ncbi:hypothetical protein ACFFWC_18585 [Plantactinospora siamensis]|uniref:Uncharacterized protein n=1 Tax=Plantactinospora siamensis TaxID=555372 RepID=A0ABV6P348_9ACTN